MREAEIENVSHQHAARLLHNKFVVVLGDSIQRAVYKDLVLLLQRESYLSLSQLKTKGELSFEQDCLIEGGRLNHMNNGTEYREVRQYCSNHHLVRFYFITRVFSRYMESIIADFKHGLQPDVVIVNSCVWDVSRYSRNWLPEYRQNLNKFFERLKAVLPEESLVVWNMTMPLGKKIIGGFLVPEIEHIGPSLRFDVIEANFYGATLANTYRFDVLDLHFLFRFSLHHRMKDGVHWNAVVHRQITCALLAHAAHAWCVELPDLTANVKNMKVECAQSSYTSDFRPDYAEYASYDDPYWHQMQQPYDGFGPLFYEDGLSSLPQLNGNYYSFENPEPNSRTEKGKGTNFVMKKKHTRRQNKPYLRAEAKQHVQNVNSHHGFSHRMV